MAEDSKTEKYQIRFSPGGRNGPLGPGETREVEGLVADGTEGGVPFDRVVEVLREMMGGGKPFWDGDEVSVELFDD